MVLPLFYVVISGISTYFCCSHLDYLLVLHFLLFLLGKKIFVGLHELFFLIF
jgi:hypothetical protein